MNDSQNKLWIDTRLSAEHMRYLHQAIGEKPSGVSTYIDDKDNWFFKSALKELTERLFYDDWNNYRKYHIKRDEFPSEFEMDRFWVNYQKQNEFNPLHNHSDYYSFVIFMKIPTHWEEQHALNFDKFRAQVASDFMFVWSECTDRFIRTQNFTLISEDEGRILFFPAWLQHMVYPFYGTEEERITISGNIRLYDPNKLKEREISGSTYEEKENTIKIMENGVKFMKEEL